MIPLTTSASRSTMSAEDVGKIVERKDGTMAKKTKKPNQKRQAWIEARKRHHLSHAQVHMARELGMNPAKLGRSIITSSSRGSCPCRSLSKSSTPNGSARLPQKQFCLSRSDADAKQRRRRTGALRGCVPWTARPGVKLHYVDGNKSRANPVGAIGEIGPQHATFRGSRP
jgi:hypothetical protein